MKREYHKWWSDRLQRDMELLVFGHAGAKVLVFPSRFGRFYEYEKLGLIESLRHKIEQGWLQLYCIDSIDVESFYCGWAHPSGRIHATNIAFRYPYLFKKLVAFSGRYDLTLNVECFNDLFDGFYNENIYFHTPNHFMPELECSWRLSKLREMDITFVIGKEDPFLQNNEHLSSILSNKGINHQLLVWNDRAHSGYYWRRMASLYI
jgi:esterase/lipase superfamily enzyme